MNICEEIYQEIIDQRNIVTIKNHLIISDAKFGERLSHIRALNIYKLEDFPERDLTFILACGYLIDGNDGNRGCYLLQHILCDNKLPNFNKDEKYKIWFEYSPYTPNKPLGRGPPTSSELDLAFGDLIQVGSNLEFIYKHPISGEGTICFVEMKILDDILVKTTVNPNYNQLAKYIKDVLTMQNCDLNDEKYPDKVHVTLVTPKFFEENRTSRLYGFKFNEYLKNIDSILNDIPDYISHEYSNDNWKQLTKTEIKDRLSFLNLHWIHYEILLDRMPENKIKESLKIIREGFLLNWNDIQRSKERFTQYIADNFDAEWVRTAIYEKNNNKSTIKISQGNRFFILKLNEDMKKAILLFNNIKIDEFIIKEENETLKMYINSIFDKPRSINDR